MVLSESRDNETRAKLVDRDGQPYYQLDGYASVTETPYEMFDMFGDYQEVISSTAFDKTLAANPDVMFLLNHRGLGMARTTNGSLELSVDETGRAQARRISGPALRSAVLLRQLEDEGPVRRIDRRNRQPVAAL